MNTWTSFLPRIAIIAAIAVSTAGCPSFHMQTPAGFAELEDDAHYDYRATNADGVTVAVRALHNSPEAGLEFWERVVDERIRRQGYEPDGPAEAVRNASGLAGVLHRYHCTLRGRAHRYEVAVYVRRSKVWVVEAGGDREVFDPAEGAVDRAMRGFRT